MVARKTRNTNYERMKERQKVRQERTTEKEQRHDRKPRRKDGGTFSLTVITLTVCVIYTTVFEYQNQVMFNMTVFDGGPRCQIDTCF